MIKTLVKFKGNWADEMNLFGFRIMEKSIWDAHLKRAERFFTAARTFEKCVGSNQYLDYKSFSHYCEHFTAFELTEAEEKVIDRMFPGDYNGSFAAIGRGEMFEYPDPEDDIVDTEY